MLNVDQIIPPPEAEEFMVKVGSKEVEEKSSRGTERRSHKLRLAFFERLLNDLTGAAAKVYANRSASKDHWLSGSTGISGVNYQFMLLKSAIRVELGISRGSREENKAIYDSLISKKDAIEADFGDQFEWLRLNNKKACRIVHKVPHDSYDESNWPDAILWMDEKMNDLIEAMQPRLDEISQSKSYMSDDVS